jgi:hypothetical protein
VTDNSFSLIASAVGTARSVMACRVEQRDSLDFFPTPPWATRALVERTLQPTMHLRRGTMTDAPAGKPLLDFEYFVRRRTHMVSPWSGKVDQRAQLAGGRRVQMIPVDARLPSSPASVIGGLPGVQHGVCRLHLRVSL